VIWQNHLRRQHHPHLDAIPEIQLYSAVNRPACDGLPNEAPFPDARRSWLLFPRMDILHFARARHDTGGAAAPDRL